MAHFRNTFFMRIYMYIVNLFSSNKQENTDVCLNDYDISDNDDDIHFETHRLFKSPTIYLK